MHNLVKKICTPQPLCEPGFKGFTTLKLKNSRVGRGLILQAISSAVTKVGRKYVDIQISAAALIPERRLIDHLRCA